ncbi:integrator complex subunit [Achlya hypogyna]|uniref:Integrator complex subunit n=1 Tax=Achlya hypogyna TaxID=1202772 RepID=A0A1V9YQI4_ACHHY|nr:integrator complex subunit [Achlya hypogyna]
MAPGRPTRSSTARGTTLRGAAKAATQKIQAKQPVRSARMKRVVYDESDDDDESADDEDEESEENDVFDEDDEEDDDEDDDEEMDEEVEGVGNVDGETFKRKRSGKKEEEAPPPPKAAPSPAKSKPPQKEANTAPKESKPMPKDPKAAPMEAKAPSKAQAKDAKNAPKDAKVAPNDAKGAPKEAKVEPKEVKPALKDAKAAAKTAKPNSKGLKAPETNPPPPPPTPPQGQDELGSDYSDSSSEPPKHDDSSDDYSDGDYDDLLSDLREASDKPAALEKLIDERLGELARTGAPLRRQVALAFLTAVCQQPLVFQAPVFTKALLKMLRSKFQGRDRAGSLEKKPAKAMAAAAKPASKESTKSISLAVLVTNLLTKIILAKPESPSSQEILAPDWADDCAKVFVDDSLNARAWVDHEFCTPFVELVKSAMAAQKLSKDVTKLIMEHLVSKLNDIKRQGPGNAPSTNLKQVMLTLMDLTVLPQGRLMAASNLDVWFSNTTYKNLARELLLKCARSCTTMAPHDLDTVENLLNMKFKSVSFPQLKTEVFSTLVRQRPEYVVIAMKVVLAKERLGASVKDVDNLKMMPLIFRETSRTLDREVDADTMFRRPHAPHTGTDSSAALASVLQEMATVPSNLPTLKNTLRKVFKSLGPDQLDVRTFCAGLLQLPPAGSLEIYTVMGDLVALVLFLQGSAVKSLQIAVPDTSLGGLNPRLGGLLTKSAVDKSARRHLAPGSAPNPRIKKEAPPPAPTAPSAITPSMRAKEELAQLIGDVQRLAVNWCLDVHQQLPQLDLIRLFNAVMRKILFLDAQPDVQATEHDRACYAFCKDMLPLHEATIAGLVRLCYSVQTADAHELLKVLETLVIRAAEGHIVRESFFRGPTAGQLPDYLAGGGLVGLHMERADFAVALYEVASARGHMYEGKAVGYSEQFWLSCSILLVLAVFSPSSIGAEVWATIPTMRCLMQMAITGRYRFPPVVPEDPLLCGPEGGDLVASNAAYVQWEASFLKSQQLLTDGTLFVALPPAGMARPPPPDVLRKVEILDKGLRLGVRLRQSRTTDFLMGMVDAAVAGGASSWAEAPEQIWWIVEIVGEEEETLSYLPQKCLCELLLLAYVDGRAVPEKAKAAHAALLQHQVPRLLRRLKKAITDNEAAVDVLSFYLDRLVSPSVDTRRISSHVLGLLGADRPSEVVAQPSIQFDWLEAVTRLPCFPALHARVLSSLENVLSHESSIDGLKRCLSALYELCAKQDVALQLAVAIGRLLTQRTSVARLLLEDAVMLARVVETLATAVARQAAAPVADVPPEWVTFPTREGAMIALPTTVVSGVVEVLSSPVEFPTNLQAAYTALVDIFFPENPDWGLLSPAQTTYECSADHLARLACVTNDRLMHAAIRTMSVSSLWDLVLSYGRSPRSMALQLSVLAQHVVRDEAACQEALLQCTQRTTLAEAAADAADHLDMYLRQEAYADLAAADAWKELGAWLSATAGSFAATPTVEPTPLCRQTPPVPVVAPVASLDALFAAAPVDPPRRIKRRPALPTVEQNAVVCQWIADGSHVAEVVDWVRVMAWSDSNLLTALGRALAASANVPLIAAVLHAVPTAVTLMTALVTDAADWPACPPPLISILLDQACGHVAQWTADDLLDPLLQLVFAEQAREYAATGRVSPLRLDLVRHLAHQDPYSIAVVLQRVVAVSFDADVQPVAQAIVLDLYSRRPHTVAMHMEAAYPGWQLAYSNVFHLPMHDDGAAFDAKVRTWLESHVSKDGTAALRRTALRHPLFVSTKIVDWAVHLHGQPWHVLGHQWHVLENMLLLLSVVKEHVFARPRLLTQVVDALVYVLGALQKYDERGLTHPAANQVFHTLYHLVHCRPEALAPYLVAAPYRDQWYPRSTKDLAALTPIVLGVCSWAVLTRPSPLTLPREMPIREVEQQLEAFKATFDATFAGSVRTSALPALVGYAKGQSPSLSKMAVGLLCQSLLLAMNADAACAPAATDAFLTCVQSPKLGLREAAMVFLEDMLVYCSPSTTHAVLSALFGDDSDIAKGSVAQVFKTELYKSA